MASTIKVGVPLALQIDYLDAAGNILTNITPDSAPQWSDTTPAVDTLTAEGNEATALGIAPGDDTINASVTIDGATFSATYALTVEAATPAVASIRIVPVPPPPGV